MQEDIKKIAKGLDYLCKTISERGVTNVYIMHSQTVKCVDWRLFNPYENPADAFMVLEALVNYCDKHHISIEIKHLHLIVNIEGARNGFSRFYKMNKSGICTAYLSLIGDKE